LPVYLMAAGELFGLLPAGAELHALKAANHERCGIYDAKLASRLFVDQPPPGGLVLPRDQFLQQIDAARETIKALATAIRRGVIAPSSQDWRQCKKCDYAGLCRVTRWEVERRREREAAQ
jgi:hypothetical protein